MSRMKIFLFICLLGLLSFVYFFLPSKIEDILPESSILPLPLTPGKVILFAATPIFGRPITNSYLDVCPEAKEFCRISTEQADHFWSSAVLFHSRDFQVIEWPRRKEQVYVWFTSESPVYEKVAVPQNYINWTMTYRKDSDIWIPYGRLEAVEKENVVDWNSIWNNKTKTAAWMASNCHTENKRMAFVEALEQKGLEIDVFGGCGNPLPNCSRYEGLQCAFERLNEYQFYMALENSNCPDYVTEKFWISLTSYWAVPIVMERRLYANYDIPESAFIAIDDFSSLHELVNYIQRVSANRTAYLEHHSWRKTHRVTRSSSNGMCELCRRLKNNSSPPKSYKDLSSWYSIDTCSRKMVGKYLGWSRRERMKCFFNSMLSISSFWGC